MRRRPTTTDLLGDALNDMGIRTTNLGRTARGPGRARILRLVEKARRRALEEIFRIADNAKRLTVK